MGRITVMAEREIHGKCWPNNPKEKLRIGDPGVDDRTTIKSMLKE
jgi:hypothetical protein